MKITADLVTTLLKTVDVGLVKGIGGAHDAGSFNDKSTWPEIKQLVEKADI